LKKRKEVRCAMAIRNTFAIPLAAGLVMTLILGIGVIPAAGQYRRKAAVKFPKERNVM
jgi:hypothetical protein